MSRWLRALRARDPELAAFHKAVRAAVVVSAVFAFAEVVLGREQLALFASFGAFALLVLNDVRGTPRDRVTAFLGLAVAGCVLVPLGTVCAGSTGLAVASMAVVGFALLLAGAMSPLAAMTTSAALLTFILPVSIPTEGALISERLLGWLLAVVVAVPAQMLIWPPPWHDRLRAAVSAALGALQQVVAVRSEDPPAQSAEVSSAIGRAADDVEELNREFESTPFRPLTSAGRGLAEAKLIDDLEWLRALSGADATTWVPDVGRALCPEDARAVWVAAARSLRSAGALFTAAGRQSTVDERTVEEAQADLTGLRASRSALSAALDRAFTDAALTEADTSRALIAAVGGSLDARRLADGTELIARHALFTAGREEPPEPDLGPIDGPPPGEPFLDAAPDGLQGRPGRTVSSPGSELASLATVRSVWFRTAARGAIGLALAVLVAKAFPVQHGFWVVLGALSVLRSTALGTGSSALKSLLGTTAGFVIAALLLAVVGHHPGWMWAIFPFVVFGAAVAPVVISFAAGQAAFTVVVVILFNLLEPTGWQVGVIRIEDVAIGCAIAVLVGVVLWPRGASGVFGWALGDALVAGSSYLFAAVAVSISSIAPTSSTDAGAGLRGRHLDALAADRRLDDAFRLVLTESTGRRVGHDAARRLVAGSTRVRLAAFSVSTFGHHERDPSVEQLTAVDGAVAALLDAARSSLAWYEEVRAALAAGDGRAISDPPGASGGLGTSATAGPGDAAASAAVVEDALTAARATGHRATVAHTLSLISAERHLAGQTRLQRDVAGQIDDLQRLRRAWWR